jgi:hypothetical protein
MLHALLGAAEASAVAGEYPVEFVSGGVLNIFTLKKNFDGLIVGIINFLESNLPVIDLELERNLDNCE